MADPDVDALAAGVRAAERPALARAITLVESTRAEHRRAAAELLRRLRTDDDLAHRIGVSGAPGVGKSTLIESLGSAATRDGHRVAVLALDPSSARGGGSILGDKTRMPTLAADPGAFIRPSPTAGTLGGVASATREAITLVEAAGFDRVIVETVGVGQSEQAVAGMVDTFLFLTIARTGDSLQGIKRGVLELVDVVAVTKADGGHEADARGCARELRGALRLLRAADESGWDPVVLTCSARSGAGLDELAAALDSHRRSLAHGGRLATRRSRQRLEWTSALVEEGLRLRFAAAAPVATLRDRVHRQVAGGELTPQEGAQLLLDAYEESVRTG